MMALRRNESFSKPGKLFNCYDIEGFLPELFTIKLINPSQYDVDVEDDVAFASSPSSSPSSSHSPTTWYDSSDFTATSSSPLPIELVLHILTLAANSSRSTACAISLLAKWATPLAHTALFSTVSVSTAAELSTIYNSVPGGWRSGWQTPVFLNRASSIRNLWVDYSAPSNVGLFNACPNLENIAISPWDLHDFLAEPCYGAIWRTRCTQLMFTFNTALYDWSEVTRTPRSLSFFFHLTHLCIQDRDNRQEIPVSLMPCLTHLAVSFEPDNEHMLSEWRLMFQKLLWNNQLQVVVALCPLCFNLGPLLANLRLSDEKLHLFAYETAPFFNLRPVWEEGARGGRGLWDRALKLEDVIADLSLLRTFSDEYKVEPESYEITNSAKLKNVTSVMQYRYL